MLLRANKFRKDKESDCRRNELGSRIFMGMVFGDYAECLHFYPRFAYERIIAGQSRGVVRASAAVTTARRAGSFGDLRGRSKHSEKQLEGVAE